MTLLKGGRILRAMFTSQIKARGRKQKVVINGVFSDWANVTSGVPVLGPFLFLLYVNDLDSIIKNSTIKLFADDVLLYAPANTQQECCALQDDLHAISDWANHWQLNLNIGKCEALAITNKWRPVKFSYYINGQPILWNNPVKYLGLLVDGKLTWSKHCRYAINKAIKSLTVCAVQCLDAVVRLSVRSIQSHSAAYCGVCCCCLVSAL